jgi:superfamily II helicase
MKNEIKKPCRKCGVEKTLDEFPINNNYKDKHTHICLICTGEKYNGSYKRSVLEKLDQIIELINKK